jgi:hypothetical protein
MDETLIHSTLSELLAAGHLSTSARVGLLSVPHAENDPARLVEKVLLELGINTIEKISVADFNVKNALDISADDIIRADRTASFDLVIDNKASVHVFAMARCIEGLYRMTRAPGLLLFHHHPYLGNGYVAAPSEYFEDVAAFNKLDILYSGVVVDGQLSSGGTDLIIERPEAQPERDCYFYVLRKNQVLDFTLPYQGQVAGPAIGIFGFEKHYLPLGEGYRYEALDSGNMAQQISKRKAATLLFRKILGRLGPRLR